MNGKLGSHQALYWLLPGCLIFGLSGCVATPPNAEPPNTPLHAPAGTDKKLTAQRTYNLPTPQAWSVATNTLATFCGTNLTQVDLPHAQAAAICHQAGEPATLIGLQLVNQGDRTQVITTLGATGGASPTPNSPSLQILGQFIHHLNQEMHQEIQRYADIPSQLNALDEKKAKGEINLEEYLHRKAELIKAL